MSVDLYREQILDHYRHPRGPGLLADADLAAEGENPLCGDQVALSLRLDGDRIEAAGFLGRGCAISQAAASMLVERLEGLTLEEASAIDSDELLGLLGIPLTPLRLKCALLPLETLRLALAEAPTAAEAHGQLAQLPEDERRQQADGQGGGEEDGQPPVER